jgi:L-amino acid N-acyltransferase YncA
MGEQVRRHRQQPLQLRWGRLAEQQCIDDRHGSAKAACTAARRTNPRSRSTITEPADWPAVRRIYAEGIATGNATFETEVPDRCTLDHAWMPEHRWVAELDGQVVGWAAAHQVSTRLVYAGVAETSIYVGDGYRGRGVGKALIHRQVTAADTAGLWTLQTAIFPENRASIALHQSAGFRTLGVRERIGQHHGIWRDTVFLERRRLD